MPNMLTLEFRTSNVLRAKSSSPLVLNKNIYTIYNIKHIYITNIHCGFGHAFQSLLQTLASQPFFNPFQELFIHLIIGYQQVHYSLANILCSPQQSIGA